MVVVTTAEPQQQGILTGVRRAASKVPEITLVFWAIKALTTGMGEAASDFLVHQMPPALAVVLGFVAFVIALGIQFKASRYVPWKYWLAVSMVGVFGTMAADVLHVGLGVPYAVSTGVFAVALAAILLAWHAAEKTLSIHSIYTPRRELFYWATVMATFALGTAAGDLSAVTLQLGYFSSGLLFAGIIAIPAIGYWRLRVNPIFAFWFAYIVTRPLGASFADWAGVSHARGGLDIGAGLVALVLTMMIVALVSYLSAALRIELAADRIQH
jgi:uncharacterized membrane-anchored protein